MARRSLHIGLNSVDPDHYDGWDGALNACEFDANDMRAIAESEGFDETTSLITAEGTAEAIMSEIERAARDLSSGDLFWITYSGHGGQVPDRDDEEEVDRSDETWVAFDRQIIDDELYTLWGKFQPGVRIVVLSDSCHSGTVTRDIDGPVPDPVSDREKAAAQSPRYRAMPRDVMVNTYRAHRDEYDGIQKALPGGRLEDVGATVLLISGCRDDQLSSDGMSNGLFTENLLTVWDKGSWNGGGYKEFHEAIRSQMPDEQQPEYTQIGASDEAFEQQRPFSNG
jgi:metacaspase-1